MKNKPKKHHIVPRAYLKRFTPDGEHAYVLLKPSNEIIGKPINIRNLCVEKGFYSSYDRYGANEVWAETTLASLEDRISNWILPQIPPNLLFPCQNMGRILDTKQKIVLVDTVLLQFWRGRSIRNFCQNIMNELNEEILEEIKSYLKDNPEKDITVPLLEKYKDTVRHNTAVCGPIVALKKDALNCNGLRYNLQNRVCYILINVTDIDFVTSDEPVTFFNLRNGRHGFMKCPLADPDSAVFYPLDAKHMVALYTQESCLGDSFSALAMILDRTDVRFVREFNLLQYNQCTHCVVAQRKESLEAIRRELKA